MKTSLLFALLVAPSFGYQFVGPWWYEKEITFTTPPKSNSPHHDYINAFHEAIKRWSGVSGLSLKTIDGTVDPCENRNLINSWGMMDTYCGEAWQGNVLARAHYRFVSTTKMIECDIVINSNFDWEVHNSLYGGYDITRVFVHEIGHCIGLDHETVNPAVMQPIYSFDWMEPEVDDINGVVTLYGSGEVTVPDIPWIPAILYIIL